MSGPIEAIWNIRPNENESASFAYLVRLPRVCSHLVVCPGGLTCCTRDMEQKLWSSAKENYERAMRSIASPVQKTFGNGANKFDNFFTSLLDESKIKLNALFEKTYGAIYLQNSDVFDDFFVNLEKYYKHGDVDLEDALQDFFSRLYQRMFTVFNVQSSFDYVYLSCVSQTMRELQPFGDVPKKLTEQLRRSFVATRTLTQALFKGTDIMKKITKINPKDTCSNALTKMSSCAPCQGIFYVQPCVNYCQNVIRGCMAYHYELNQSWDEFVDHIQQLSDRLLGPFDIEAVVAPIGIKISDAIMNFKASGHEVTSKVAQACGTIRLQKRQVQSGLAYGVYARPMTLPPSMGQIPEESRLNRILKEIQNNLEATKQFWNRLPNEMCQNDLIGSGKRTASGVCWNGKEAGSYALPLVGEGLLPQAKNPEVPVDVSRQDNDINEQIFALRQVTKHLEDAINGQNVNWLPSTRGNNGQSDESQPYLNQEHEGSGTGCNPNSDDEDCYDYESYFYDDGSGSGSGDYEDYPINSIKNHQSPQEGSNDENWPPWLREKSQPDDSTSDDIEIESKSHEDGRGGHNNHREVNEAGRRPNDNHLDKNYSSGGGDVSFHTLRGLFYYLVPLMTCWVGNAAISW
ncbi:glypican-4-like isoform X2 [Tigriopus californicus]|uniref:glypican-4-like isoform X2 n=1 Tax=Tigriopus californicus TaxID=6832 RepID=UPI0027D9F0A2|nr:glypican-4-like isoform X2 [Tigriopus californicus]